MSLQSPQTSQMTRRMMRAEMLDAETEQELARAWRDKRDHAAMHRLVQAYMRLAISMASKFRRTGVSQSDLIQEASLGLMKAADKFDPDRGVRFSTYAVWWIRAGLQDHVMRNWSLVRTGSTTSQKSLFFNLRRVRAQLEREAMANGEHLDSHQMCERMASEIGVSLADTQMMMGRLSGADASLNAQQSTEESGREWIELLEDENAQGAETVELSHDESYLKGQLQMAMDQLNEREKFILRERRLNEEPRTLASIGDEMALSKERVRQLEVSAFTKMRSALERQGVGVHDLVS
ncbi:RNA polymerase factor sigma-32 [Shimia thalassica]|uniref:RNA polymerase factor sigma-32 n=1 Tax=Shimia thalassica TaxID=1715693 RepID=UPI0026E29538|nr:RNA polymerase factor sigma-32 [Shimia thalassica]MDO6481295.1 RNA polymerase factor sigma-32 [Shimia thalassica]MDP2582128.1 RNA polymerase factor sigma-32 [Shimia thalassica]